MSSIYDSNLQRKQLFGNIEWFRLKVSGRSISMYGSVRGRSRETSVCPADTRFDIIRKSVQPVIVSIIRERTFHRIFAAVFFHRYKCHGAVSSHAIAEIFAVIIAETA